MSYVGAVFNSQGAQNVPVGSLVFWRVVDTDAPPGFGNASRVAAAITSRGS